MSWRSVLRRDPVEDVFEVAGLCAGRFGDLFGLPATYLSALDEFPGGDAVNPSAGQMSLSEVVQLLARKPWALGSQLLCGVLRWFL